MSVANYYLSLPYEIIQETLHARLQPPSAVREITPIAGLGKKKTVVS
jgi:hypothetical protein